jgi:putative hydrolase of the HAD superfamily
VDAEIKVVAFDVDGTLYGHGAYLWRMALSGLPDLPLAYAYNRARTLYREEQGERPVSPPDREGYLRHLALLMLRVLKRQSDERSVHKMTALVEKRLYGTWNRLYRRVRGRRGMKSAIATLHQRGYCIAVLSDFPLAGKLEALGILPYVDVALCSEDTGYLKPDPHVFARLLELVDSKADEVLYVGDSYRKDVLGANGAGIHSLLLAGGRKRVYPKAEYVVHSFQELLSLFG